MIFLHTLRATSRPLCNCFGPNPFDFHNASNGTDEIACKEANNVGTKRAENEVAFLRAGKAMGVNWEDQSQQDVKERQQKKNHSENCGDSDDLEEIHNSQG